MISYNSLLELFSFFIHHESNKIDRTLIDLIIDEASKLLQNEQSVLYLKGDYHIVGDIHGNLDSLLKVFEKTGFPSGENKYVFLGDYIDRGSESIQVVTFLFCIKCLFSESVILLRGNHEIVSVNTFYGFKAQCELMYDLQLFKAFNLSFEKLPIAAVINNYFFCVHGGVSKLIQKVSDLSLITKFSQEQDDLSKDLLWSDPKEISGFYSQSPRLFGFYFSLRALEYFLEVTNLSHVIRSHEFCMYGYDFPFGEGKPITTVFSSDNYEGNTNFGSIISITNTTDISICSYCQRAKKQKRTIPDTILDLFSKREKMSIRSDLMAIEISSLT